MHAVLVTFESAASLADLEAPFAAYADVVRSTPGLIAKIWLMDAPTVGGFHLFADRASAEGYLAGELFAGITTNPAFQQFRVEHFTVLHELTAVTGRSAGTAHRHQLTATGMPFPPPHHEVSQGVRLD